MSLQNFNPNLDIGEKAKINFNAVKNIDESELIASLIPSIQKSMTKLYKLTGKYYNEILDKFMCGFLDVDKGDESDFYYLLTEFRHLMIPKYKNISYYIANYITCSTAQEVAYLNDGLSFLCDYYEWRNQHSKNHIATYKNKETFKEDLNFIQKSGANMFVKFPTIACVYLPNKYVSWEDIDKRQNGLKKLIGEKAIEKLKSNLKQISDASVKCSEYDNLKIAPSPNQETLDRFM